jgi:hypothetical protein
VNKGNPLRSLPCALQRSCNASLVDSRCYREGAQGGSHVHNPAGRSSRRGPWTRRARSWSGRHRKPDIPEELYVGWVGTLSIAVAAGIGLVIIAIMATPILIAVVVRAAGRNENRAESEQDREHQERESRQSTL